MVDVFGHLGMALLWLAPAWLALDRSEAAATFVATGFWFGMLPDIDLVLSNWFPGLVHHHGVFHTILAVTVLAAVLGPLVGYLLEQALGDSNWSPARASIGSSAFGSLAVWIPGLSHLFADVLSAPDTAPPIEPFWPLLHSQVFYVDVLYYTSVWATVGVFAVGLAANVSVWAWRKRAGQTDSSST